MWFSPKKQYRKSRMEENERFFHTVLNFSSLSVLLSKFHLIFSICNLDDPAYNHSNGKSHCNIPFFKQYAKSFPSRHQYKHSGQETYSAVPDIKNIFQLRKNIVQYSKNQQWQTQRSAQDRTRSELMTFLHRSFPCKTCGKCSCWIDYPRIYHYISALSNRLILQIRRRQCNIASAR